MATLNQAAALPAIRIGKLMAETRHMAVLAWLDDGENAATPSPLQRCRAFIGDLERTIGKLKPHLTEDQPAAFETAAKKVKGFWETFERELANPTRIADIKKFSDVDPEGKYDVDVALLRRSVLYRYPWDFAKLNGVRSITFKNSDIVLLHMAVLPITNNGIIESKVVASNPAGGTVTKSGNHGSIFVASDFIPTCHNEPMDTEISLTLMSDDYSVGEHIPAHRPWQVPLTDLILADFVSWTELEDQFTKAFNEVLPMRWAQK